MDRQEIQDVLFRDIVELADLAVLAIDHDFRVVYANKYLSEKIAGIPQSALIGMSLPENAPVPDEDLQRVAEHSKRVLMSGRAERIEHWALHKDGSRRLMYWSTTPKLSADGRVEYLVAAGMDVTDQRREKLLLEDIAHRDALTNLHNRMFFEKRFAEELVTAAQSNMTIALFYIDLDGFKPVNDQFGHEIGDAVLCQVASRLKKGLRQNDIICRIGGDEFVVILPGVSSHDVASRIAEQMIERLSMEYIVSDNRCNVGASIGISFCEAGTTELQELVRKADLAMYLAKRKGKGQFAFSE